MSRHRFHIWAAVGGVFVLVCLGGGVLTARQKPEGPKPAPPAPPVHKGMTAAEAGAAVDKVFETYDLTPHELPAIPDNPPPHEGAMISYPPYVIEPPDLVLIEVLEAPPGRPISGERLVRPDGKISLGFYGEVHVAGLTLDQAKVKIIKHLRKYLSDDGLGLFKRGEEGMEAVPQQPPGKIQIPAPPEPGGDPFKLDEERKPKDETKKPHAAASLKGRPIVRTIQSSSRYGGLRLQRRARLIARRQDQDEKKPEEPKKPVEIPLEAGGKVTVTIEVQSGEKKEELPQAGEEESQFIEGAIDPKECERVFVDVTAYNSKNYYVLGDVPAPGRLPCTGNETVLDALQYGGGLLSTAEPRDIHLVRPARGGKPAHVYKVDLEAIQNRGDTTTNYQIFPGDRLVVGRNEVVKKTIQLDRLAAPLQTATTAIRQETSMLQSLKTLSPEKQDALLKDLVDFWIKALNQPDGVKFDENTLRDALIKRLK